MFKKSKSWTRQKKWFHKLHRIRWWKIRERFPVVQLEIIEGQIQYNSEPIQTGEFRFNELDYMNEFHEENNQSLIWIRETQYKCEKRKILLTQG